MRIAELLQNIPWLNQKRRGSRSRSSGSTAAVHWWQDRLIWMRIGVVVMALLFCLRLFNLQILSYDDYKQAADGGHKFFKKLFPQRGQIYLRERAADASDADALTEVAGERLFPAVTNREYSIVYAVPNVITDVGKTAEALAPILGLAADDIKKKLDKPGDKYEVIVHKVTDDKVDAIKALNLTGIYFSPETQRFYPEKKLGGQLFGFMGYGKDNLIRGLYGLEGYFNDILKGKEGSLRFETDALGAFIPIGDKKVVEAVDGSSLVLTVDRVIQMVTCDKLEKWVKQHGADGGSVVIMNPKTGAIMAMCSSPNYDPDDRAKSHLDNYNNSAIFTAYEPGSIFKPITMAIGIDTGKVTPTSTYEDTGEVKIGPYTIHNSDLKAHGVSTMTDVLDESLNTGTIFVARKVGLEAFRKYIHAFGFGALTGIEMDTESPGTVAALDQKQEIYLATTSFGQGLTVTPLQITNAFGALANGGQLMQPYIVDEIIKPDGTKIKTEPKMIRRVVSERTASLTNGMLVTVVRKGHGKKAGVPLYYVAGKTGTAQVPKKNGGGYEANDTIGSFAGFAPVDNPQFVMLVKIDHPRDVQWAESSAAPLFGDLAKFLVKYMEIPPDEVAEDVPAKGVKK